VTRAELIATLRTLDHPDMRPEELEALRTAILTLREESNRIVRPCPVCCSPATLRCRRCNAWFCLQHGQPGTPNPWGLCSNCTH
jgi:hypothetical protein